MSRGEWRGFWAALPGTAFALLPKLACPLCWPAYAGLLSSVGLGFLLVPAYLLPLTFLFLATVLVALGFRARQGRGYGPLMLGAMDSALLLMGKISPDQGWVTYGSVLLLVAASLWNTWPRRGAAGVVAYAAYSPAAETLK